MPAAANPMKTLTVAEAAPGAPAMPGAELFAAMLGGAEYVAEAPTDAETVAATAEATDGEVQPNLDILAPLIAQQQIVPTVSVPSAGRDVATGETAVSETGSASPSPLVPSDVEGRIAQTFEPGTGSTARIADEALTGAHRIRSGPAEEAKLPHASQGVETKAAEVQVTLGETKGVGKGDAPASRPPAMPTIAAPVQTASDQPTGAGQPQPQAAATLDVQVQQPSTSFSITDARSLMASLTGTAGPAQAGGAAQQLGEALAAQVLDLAGGGEWLDQLSQEIGRAAEGSGPLRFRLTPESLGELKVEIAQSDRGAIVRMTVSTEAAQAALADAQPRLAAEARAQGLRIAESEVNLAGGQAQQNQQGRESARQQAGGGDQPLRALRATASTQTQAEPHSGQAAERYA